MKQPLSWIVAAAGVAVIAACAPQAPAGDTPAPSGGPPAQAAPAGGMPVSVYTGVYSDDQADRGQRLQRQNCAACHSTSDWSAGRLLSGWSGQTAFDLVSHIRNTMPLNAPGSLSLQEYTDIFAYMLELNDVPAGAGELEATDAALQAVEIEYQR